MQISSSTFSQILKTIDAISKGDAAKALPSIIEILKQLPSLGGDEQKYLLQVEGKLIEALSQKTLEVGAKYWAESMTDSSGNLKLRELVQMPQIFDMAQSFDALPPISLEVLQKLVDEVTTKAEMPKEEVKPNAKDEPAANETTPTKSNVKTDEKQKIEPEKVAKPQEKTKAEIGKEAENIEKPVVLKSEETPDTSEAQTIEPAQAESVKKQEIKPEQPSATEHKAAAQTSQDAKINETTEKQTLHQEAEASKISTHEPTAESIKKEEIKEQKQTAPANLSTEQKQANLEEKVVIQNSVSFYKDEPTHEPIKHAFIEAKKQDFEKNVDLHEQKKTEQPMSKTVQLEQKEAKTQAIPTLPREPQKLTFFAPQKSSPQKAEQSEKTAANGILHVEEKHEHPKISQQEHLRFTEKSEPSKEIPHTSAKRIEQHAESKLQKPNEASKTTTYHQKENTKNDEIKNTDKLLYQEKVAMPHTKTAEKKIESQQRESEAKTEAPKYEDEVKEAPKEQESVKANAKEDEASQVKSPIQEELKDGSVIDKKDELLKTKEHLEKNLFFQPLIEDENLKSEPHHKVKSDDKKEDLADDKTALSSTDEIISNEATKIDIVAQPLTSEEKKLTEPATAQTQPEKTESAGKSETTIAQIKTTLLEHLANSKTEQQFVAISNVILALNKQVYTFALNEDGRRGILQFKYGGQKEAQKVHFYSAFEQLGPLKGQIWLAGDELFLNIEASFESTLGLLRDEIKKLDIFSRANLSLNKDIKELFTVKSSLLDMEG